MKESDFLSLKRELWLLIVNGGLLVTNQNLDAVLEEAYQRLRVKCAEEILEEIAHRISPMEYSTKAITSTKER